MSVDTGGKPPPEPDGPPNTTLSSPDVEMESPSNFKGFSKADSTKLQGVIRDVSTEFSDEYLKNKIKKFEIYSNFEVVNVSRINRETVTDDKINYVPTKSCVVSFKTQVLPKYVTINKVLKEIEPYQQKVLLCFNCLRFGHQGKHCRSNPRCNNCQKDHNTKECQETTLTPKCFSCVGDHFTTNLKSCPEFKRQKLIKECMTNSNINYHDANKQIPRKSYADVTSNNIIKDSHQQNLPSSNSPLVNQSINSSSVTRPFTFSANSNHNKYTVVKSSKGSKRQRPNSPVLTQSDPEYTF
ncbi:uncharacterized protein LOC126878530 [Diabrotica virgifera virgifera]|uniref:CCHC-type domain-containing protein n=1 Tax=Diabrotica virgifera virgifera TaxID=50390 RepID=A0ABM5JH30_DIAVI|nr:uncharacterized protein LOC126878530 [Diabrotica virgifera virgifera]